MKCRYCRFDGTQSEVDDHLTYCTSIGDPEHEPNLAGRHLFRDFVRPEPLGKGYARCWCGWNSARLWNQWVAEASHQDHQRNALEEKS